VSEAAADPDRSHFMREAIALACESVDQRRGGPFGAVVVLNGEIVGRGQNQVTSANDPTAHAEMQAIREACAQLETFQLSDCELYTSCEPCPMCLAAIYWARLRSVYFACTRSDAAAVGFDDALIYDELARDLADRQLPLTPLLRAEALSAMKKWEELEGRVDY
jgi:guanine deaminase